MASDPTTLIKGSEEIQCKKALTGMQSVTCPFRNITTLNIINIVDQRDRVR